MIAGAASGVGKTTITVGVMAALRRRGVAVQPFKVGPDYIDPSFHMLATGVPSRNLDGWMVPPAALKELFDRACRRADVAVIEGVMGLFDGVGGRDEEGSTAQVAKAVGAPVVLVLDVRGTARSAAAMALGYARFDPGLPLAGFLLNNVGSETHFRWAREAIEATGVGPVLGYLPRRADLKLPERHLGLVPAAENPMPEGFLDRLVELVESHVDLDGLMAIAVSRGECGGEGSGDEGGCAPKEGGTAQDRGGPALFPDEPLPPRAVIAVAWDEAFSFYYQDNLDLLEAHGARLVRFSPLRDAEIPPETGALYLGGGFPEMFAAQLAANRGMLESIRGVVRDGLPTYAECGGLMYLCEAIAGMDGRLHEMVGVLPGRCSMEEKRLKLGYLETRSLRDTPLGPSDTLARGHEFHWSRWDGLDPTTAAYALLNQEGRPEGYARGSLLASFVHLHFASNPALAPAFVHAAVGG